MPKLATKECCTGCTACANSCSQSCIKMLEDKEGFWIHNIDKELCVECGSCERICPVINPLDSNKYQTKAYAAYSKEEIIRESSSSGGIFTEIAKIILAYGGVAYGATYDEMFKVEHCYIDNEEELGKLRGAKYSESSLGNTFVDVRTRLKQGQKVLFTGTPCQVVGLKAFLQKEYDNLFCVDFVCHGVPSPMAWKAYVEYRAKQDANGEMPILINLRDKSTGWSKYRYSNWFQYKSGIEHSCVSSNSLFMKLFVGDYISRESCSECKFKGYSRVSDITLGDFWGIWDIEPEMDDNKGTSLVLIQSDKGRKMFDDILGRIKSKEVTLEQASLQNSSILKSSPANPKRRQVLDLIREGRIGELESMFKSLPKENLSMLRRVLRRLKRLCTQNGK